MLSSEQKRHFEVFGFLVLRRLFDDEEMQWMAQRQQEQFDLEENVASQMPSSQELHSQARGEGEKMIMGGQEDE